MKIEGADKCVSHWGSGTKFYTFYEFLNKKIIVIKLDPNVDPPLN